MTTINALAPGGGLDPGLAPNFIGQGIDGANRRYSAPDIGALLGPPGSGIPTYLELVAVVEAQQTTIATLQAAVTALEAGNGTTTVSGGTATYDSSKYDGTQTYGQ